MFRAVLKYIFISRGFKGVYSFCEESINILFKNGKKWKIYAILIVSHGNYL